MAAELKPLNPSEILLLRELETGPATVHDLIPVLHLARNSVLRLVRRLHSAKRIRICGWERSHGGARRVFALQTGKVADVPKPPKLTKGQIVRRYRARHPQWYRDYRRRWWADNAQRLNAKRRKKPLTGMQARGVGFSGANDSSRPTSAPGAGFGSPLGSGDLFEDRA